MSLFGASSSRGQSKNLVEFRAGKMTMRGNMVHPDKRKGLVYVYQSNDSLMHFCWKDRQTGNVEDDWIIFPDDCEYLRVPQCTTGRVFLLKFKSSNKKNFYWMQEPKSDKDEEYCRKVNDFLNNPPQPGSQSSRSGGSSGERDLQTLLNSMSQQQLMQLFGNVGGMSGLSSGLSSLLVPSEGMGRGSSTRSRSSGASTQQRPPAVPTSTTAAAATPSATTAPANSTTPATTGAAAQLSNLTNLQQILSGIQVPENAGAASSKISVDLAEGLNTDVLQPILSNPEFMRQLGEYVPAVPQDAPAAEKPEDLVRETVQSPQFSQALSIFSAAFQSGQLGPLIQQFGLGTAAVEAAQRGDMEAFIGALQSEEQKDKKPKEDDSMALD